MACSCLSFSGLGRKVVGLGWVLVDVIELPVVTGDHIRWRLGAELPGKCDRRCRRYPPVMVDGAIAEHLEILRGVPSGSFGARLVPRVGHAYAFDGNLLDAIDCVGLRNARRFE